MATLTKGITFASGDVVTPSKLNQLVDNAMVTNIANADISVAAAISDTKLNTITTAGKVANTATTATSANTANAIVARDALGNFSGGTYFGSFSGTLDKVQPAWRILTTTSTAVSGDSILADTTLGSWTLTLPATPSTGATVTIYDGGGRWFNNNLTVARNGSTIDGLNENLVCDVSKKIVVLIYTGLTWAINN